MNQNQMQEEFKCPLCEEKVYSGLGEGCLMCGMVLEEDKKFCSKTCEGKYIEINLQYPEGHKYQKGHKGGEK